MGQSTDPVVPRLGGTHPPADRARVLLEINNAVVSHLDLGQVLKSISDCLRREIQHDFAALALYDPERHELRLHALDFAENRGFLQKGQLIPLVGTPASLAFATRKPVLRHRPDFEEFPADIMKEAYARGVRSGCAVPLVCHDHIVGSMMIASLRESAFTEEDAELLTHIGTQVAIAVNNAVNFERARTAEHEAQRQSDRSRLLLEINNAVTSQLDLSKLLKSISRSLRSIITYDSAFLGLCDDDAAQMQVQGLDLGTLSKDASFQESILIPLDGTPEQKAVLTRRPVRINSIAELASFSSPWVHHAIEQGIKSGCVVPLIARDSILGILGLVSMQEGSFSDDVAILLEQCSGQVAIAVENAINFEKTRQAERDARHERDRSRLLLDINNALVAHLDLRELVTAISCNLRHVIQHDSFNLSLYDAESKHLIACAFEADSNPLRESFQYDPTGTVSGRAFESGQPVYVPKPDPVQFPSPVSRYFFESGLRTIYAVPVTVHAKKLGVLTFASKKEDAWTEEERDLLQEITKQAALASANAIAMRDLEALKEKLAQEKLYLEDEIRSELNFEEIVGQSNALRQVLKLVETVAASDSTVLLLGETGTGKELVARAVHDHSRRKARTFVKMNCAAIPTGLLESELFGHEKGAFTGAITQKAGRLELADQGTLFLDEVGDIPPEIQPKLLRALQEREFERLGSTHTRKVNVRLVAATNRDLEKMTQTREFRSDLYYRLNVFPIRIPPLRERTEDIPLLVRYFAEKFARQMQKRIESIPADTMARLQLWHWPGNVRELENLIERAVILTTGNALQVPLPEVKGAPMLVSPTPQISHSDAAERELIIKTLRDTRGVLAGPNGAASRLGLKRTTLQYKIKKLGITQSQWWPSQS